MEKMISDNDGFSGYQQIAVSGNNVYVVWEDIRNGGDNDIFFKRSPDGGASFSEKPMDLSDNNEFSAFQIGSSSEIGVPAENAYQQIAVSGDNVYVVWIDRRNGPDTDIFFRGSTNGG